LHRIGDNFETIPINCPFRASVHNYERDGRFVVNGNGGGGVNFDPNTAGGPVADPT